MEDMDFKSPIMASFFQTWMLNLFRLQGLIVIEKTNTENTLKELLACLAICLIVPSMYAQSSAFTFAENSLRNAAAYSESEGGSSTLVLQDRQLLFEQYHNGADANTPTHLHSATKGFWSLLAAHLLETGLIESYEEPVANTITEWKNSDLHPWKNLITVRHLLQLSSGLSQDVFYIQGTDAASPNIYQHVVDSLRVNFYPGNQFQYGPSNYYAFGVLLEKKLQAKGIDQNPLEYLDSVFFQPIGLQFDSWVHDAAGNPHIPNGCYITSRNWIKFGQLLLQKGYWEGQQLVDSSLVQDLSVADGPNQGHGKFLWLNNQDGMGAVSNQKAPPGASGGFMYYLGYNDIIGLLGAGKNRMYIIPSLNAVVLRQTLLDNDGFSDHAFLARLLQGVVTSTDSPSPALPAVDIFPNPAQGQVQITFSQAPSTFTAELFDLQGKRLLHEKNESRLDISRFDPGLYVLKIRSRDGVITKKLQIAAR
jgi:CubicO group peptidase (beta-lactamase class C family)